MVAAIQDNPEAAYQLETRAMAESRRLGDLYSLLQAGHNAAVSLREIGRVVEAREQRTDLFAPVLAQRDPEAIVTVAEDYTAVLSVLGQHAEAAVLFGAADAMRERWASTGPDTSSSSAAEACRSRTLSAPPTGDRTSPHSPPARVVTRAGIP